MKNHLRKQYQDYPDEKLIHILSEENNAYTEDAKAIAEELLLERGYDVTHVEEIDQETAAQLDEMERPDGLVQQDMLVQEVGQGVTGRINSLIDGIEQQEEKLQDDWSTELKALSEEDLVEQYTNILGPFIENTASKIEALGPIAEMELRAIIAEVNARTLKLPAQLVSVDKRAKHTLNEMTIKEARRKRAFNIFLGLLLTIVPVAFFVDGVYRNLLVLSFVVGVQRIYVGLQAMSLAQEKML